MSRRHPTQRSPRGHELALNTPVEYVGGGRFTGNQYWPDNGDILHVGDIGSIVAIDPLRKFPYVCNFPSVAVRLTRWDLRRVEHVEQIRSEPASPASSPLISHAELRHELPALSRPPVPPTVKEPAPKAPPQPKGVADTRSATPERGSGRARSHSAGRGLAASTQHGSLTASQLLSNLSARTPEAGELRAPSTPGSTTQQLHSVLSVPSLSLSHGEVPTTPRAAEAAGTPRTPTGRSAVPKVMRPGLSAAMAQQRSASAPASQRRRSSSDVKQPPTPSAARASPRGAASPAGAVGMKRALSVGRGRGGRLPKTAAKSPAVDILDALRTPARQPPPRMLDGGSAGAPDDVRAEPSEAAEAPQASTSDAMRAESEGESPLRLHPSRRSGSGSGSEALPPRVPFSISIPPSVPSTPTTPIDTLLEGAREGIRKQIAHEHAEDQAKRVNSPRSPAEKLGGSAPAVVHSPTTKSTDRDASWSGRELQPPQPPPAYISPARSRSGTPHANEAPIAYAESPRSALGEKEHEMSQADGESESPDRGGSPQSIGASTSRLSTPPPPEASEAAAADGVDVVSPEDYAIEPESGLVTSFDAPASGRPARDPPPLSPTPAPVAAVPAQAQTPEVHSPVTDEWLSPETQVSPAEAGEAPRDVSVSPRSPSVQHAVICPPPSPKDTRRQRSVSPTPTPDVAAAPAPKPAEHSPERPRSPPLQPQAKTPAAVGTADPSPAKPADEMSFAVSEVSAVVPATSPPQAKEAPSVPRAEQEHAAQPPRLRQQPRVRAPVQTPPVAKGGRSVGVAAVLKAVEAELPPPHVEAPAGGPKAADTAPAPVPAPTQATVNTSVRTTPKARHKRLQATSESSGGAPSEHVSGGTACDDARADSETTALAMPEGLWREMRARVLSIGLQWEELVGAGLDVEGFGKLCSETLCFNTTQTIRLRALWNQHVNPSSPHALSHRTSPQRAVRAPPADALTLWQEMEARMGQAGHSVAAMRDDNVLPEDFARVCEESLGFTRLESLRLKTMFKELAPASTQVASAKVAEIPTPGAQTAVPAVHPPPNVDGALVVVDSEDGPSAPPLWVEARKRLADMRLAPDQLRAKGMTRSGFEEISRAVLGFTLEESIALGDMWDEKGGAVLALPPPPPPATPALAETRAAADDRERMPAPAGGVASASLPASRGVDTGDDITRRALWRDMGARLSQLGGSIDELQQSHLPAESFAALCRHGLGFPTSQTATLRDLYVRHQAAPPITPPQVPRAAATPAPCDMDLWRDMEDRLKNLGSSLTEVEASSRDDDLTWMFHDALGFSHKDAAELQRTWRTLRAERLSVAHTAPSSQWSMPSSRAPTISPSIRDYAAPLVPADAVADVDDVSKQSAMMEHFRTTSEVYRQVHDLVMSTVDADRDRFDWTVTGVSKCKAPPGKVAHFNDIKARGGDSGRMGLLLYYSPPHAHHSPMTLVSHGFAHELASYGQLSFTTETPELTEAGARTLLLCEVLLGRVERGGSSVSSTTANKRSLSPAPRGSIPPSTALGYRTRWSSKRATQYLVQDADCVLPRFFVGVNVTRRAGVRPGSLKSNGLYSPPVQQQQHIDPTGAAPPQAPLRSDIAAQVAKVLTLPPRESAGGGVASREREANGIDAVAATTSAPVVSYENEATPHAMTTVAFDKHFAATGTELPPSCVHVPADTEHLPAQSEANGDNDEDDAEVAPPQRSPSPSLKTQRGASTDAAPSLSPDDVTEQERENEDETATDTAAAAATAAVEHEQFCPPPHSPTFVDGKEPAALAVDSWAALVRPGLRPLPDGATATRGVGGSDGASVGTKLAGLDPMDAKALDKTDGVPPSPEPVTPPRMRRVQAEAEAGGCGMPTVPAAEAPAVPADAGGKVDDPYEGFLQSLVDDSPLEVSPQRARLMGTATAVTPTPQSQPAAAASGAVGTVEVGPRRREDVLSCPMSSSPGRGKATGGDRDEGHARGVPGGPGKLLTFDEDAHGTGASASAPGGRALIVHEPSGSEDEADGMGVLMEELGSLENAVAERLQAIHREVGETRVEASHVAAQATSARHAAASHFDFLQSLIERKKTEVLGRIDRRERLAQQDLHSMSSILHHCAEEYSSLHRHISPIRARNSGTRSPPHPL